MFIIKVCVIIHVITTVATAEPYKRLGHHSPPSKGATILAGKFPPPAVFYHHFVHLGQPLLMKNVLEETGYPAFKKWTDKYLSEHYGREIVDIERGKKEDRGGENLELNLAKFLEIYTESDLYMVHTVPDSMKEEVMVPHTLQCGGFQNNLQDAVLWFSSGETKSVLHYDDVDNINCLLDGEKKLVLIDKTYRSMVEEYGWVEERSYSLVDVDNVHPEKFFGILRAPWIQISMQKGDCVYIPYKWYHHVYSPAGRNLAVNLWFSHLLWFNQTDCVNTGNQSKPLSQFKTASSNQILRYNFLSVFSEQKEVSQKSFLQGCGCRKKDDCSKIWDKINTNSDRKLTWEEFYSFNIDEMVKQFPLCFYSDRDIQEMYKAVKDKDEKREEENGSEGSVEKTLENVVEMQIEDTDIKSDETKTEEIEQKADTINGNEDLESEMKEDGTETVTKAESVEKQIEYAVDERTEKDSNTDADYKAGESGKTNDKTLKAEHSDHDEF